MTRDEAIQVAKELGAHHADRATHRWIPREKEDHSWEVVKVELPPGMRVDPDDPRSAFDQNLGRGRG